MRMEEEKKKLNNNNMSNTNGEIKLPIGFRFRPTDEELVIHYLKRKALSLPLPASVIPDHLHLFHSHPCSLPGNLREKRYYFSKRTSSKYSRIIATTSGFWKAIGKAKQVISSGSKNDAVGTRNSWAFYEISNGLTHGHCSKTRWLMHEFQLLKTQNPRGKVEDYHWVVCRIFQRKMRPKNRIQGISAKMGIIDSNCPNYIDFRVEYGCDLGPPQVPSSPCSISDSC